MFKDLEELIRENLREDEGKKIRRTQSKEKSSFFGEDFSEMINVIKIAFKKQPPDKSAIRDLGKFMVDRKIKARVLIEISEVIIFILAVIGYFITYVLLTTKGSPIYIPDIDKVTATILPLAVSIFILISLRFLVYSIIIDLFDLAYARKVRRIFEKRVS